MIIAILFAIAAVVFTLWLLFTLAIYALPLFAAVSAGLWAHHAGSGLLAVVGLAFAAGIGTLILGQFLFLVIRSPIIRLAIALLFVIPAAIAGYHAVLGVASMGVTSDVWRQALAWGGAFVIGAAAWGRIASLSPSTGAGPQSPPGSLQAGAP